MYVIHSKNASFFINKKNQLLWFMSKQVYYNSFDLILTIINRITIQLLRTMVVKLQHGLPIYHFNLEVNIHKFWKSHTFNALFAQPHLQIYSYYRFFHYRINTHMCVHMYIYVGKLYFWYRIIVSLRFSFFLLLIILVICLLFFFFYNLDFFSLLVYDIDMSMLNPHQHQKYNHTHIYLNPHQHQKYNLTHTH